MDTVGYIFKLCLLVFLKKVHDSLVKKREDEIELRINFVENNFLSQSIILSPN